MNQHFCRKLYSFIRLNIPPEGIPLEKTQHRRHKEVINRLSRIEGHVRGLRKMVEEDKDCSDILLQVAAVRAALNQVGRILLEDHMESCIVEATKQGQGEKAIEELKAALMKFIM
jgi:CsoR family transcriptional regulator, copper-sensing transcriptional repressor